jgi:putative membrane protein insertion efficiency factor
MRHNHSGKERVYLKTIQRGRSGIARTLTLMNHQTVGWVIKEVIIGLITVYQNTFSILFGPCCRFTPSCSTYASLSIQRFGIIEGARLTLRRLIKCHPFHTGGYDPVPEIPKHS